MRTHLAAVAAATALLLGACGDDRADTGAAAPAASTPSASPTTTTAPTTVAPTQPEPTLGPIPADFPLDLDLRADPADGGGREGPSTQAQGWPPTDVCGTRVWPPGDVRGRLAVSGWGPEYADVRELVLLADAEAADAALTALEQVVSTCGSDPNPLAPQESRRVWQVLGTDTGYSATTFAQTYDDGLGGAVVQVTRVADALLLVGHSGELSTETVRASAVDLSRVSRTIAAQMCVFAEAGCSR